MAEEIKNIEELLQQVLGNKIKVKKYSTKSLTAPGENYGSIMLSVDVQLINDENEHLHLVAKMCPKSAFIRQVFNIGVTFKKEILFYKTILPTLQDFLLEHNCKPFSLFAKYYGSRFSLDSEKLEIDEDCCLFLENVKLQGFDIGNRMKGFNLDCASFIIKDLAMFHAVPIAFKLKEPLRFKEKILPHIMEPTYTHESLPEEMMDRFINVILERINNCGKHKTYIEKIEKLLRESAVNYYIPHTNIVEPFASLVHSDFWTNNTMIKLDNDQKCIANCMVDFQLLIYGSPLSDLMFFLYSSVEIPVVKEHYDELIDLYYETFMDVLKKLDVPNLQQFSKELYDGEINRVMKHLQIHHLLFMLTPIYSVKDKSTEMAKLDEESFTTEAKLDEERYYEKLMFLLDQFIEKKWL